MDGKKKQYEAMRMNLEYSNYQIGEDEMQGREKDHEDIPILLEDVFVEDDHSNHRYDVADDSSYDGKGCHW